MYLKTGCDKHQGRFPIRETADCSCPPSDLFIDSLKRIEVDPDARTKIPLI